MSVYFGSATNVELRKERTVTIDLPGTIELPQFIYIEGNPYKLRETTVTNGTNVPIIARYTPEVNGIDVILKQSRSGGHLFFEAKALTMLKGRSYVPILYQHGTDFSRHDESIDAVYGLPNSDYIFEEYIYGTPLKNSFDTLLPEQQKKLALGLANMIKYNLSEGVALKDWKIEDIILDENANFKIQDWGMSEFRDAVSSDAWEKIIRSEILGFVRTAYSIYAREEMLPPFMKEYDLIPLDTSKIEAIKSALGEGYQFIEPFINVEAGKEQDAFDECVRRLEKS
jgi:serine/threonine protein kinase